MSMAQLYIVGIFLSLIYMKWKPNEQGTVIHSWGISVFDIYEVEAALTCHS